MRKEQYLSIPGWCYKNGMYDYLSSNQKKVVNFLDSIYHRDRDITLEIIGENLDITRERARQIIVSMRNILYSLSHMRPKIPYDWNLKISHDNNFLYNCFSEYVNNSENFRDEGPLDGRHYYLMIYKIYTLGFDSIVKEVEQKIIDKVEGRECFKSTKIGKIKGLPMWGQHTPRTRKDIGEIIYNYLSSIHIYHV